MESENKTNQNHGHQNEQDWKARFNELVQSCQTELKRTTQIGMKMLTASQSNAQLHEAYEDLGRMAYEAIKDGSLDWEVSGAKALVEKIEELSSTLEGLEEDVKNIKKGS